MKKFTRIKGAVGWVGMEHIQNKGAEATYNKISNDSAYDQIIDYDARTEALSQLVNNISFVDKKVLDIACGSGAFINAVIDKKPLEIIGVDISKGMLELAKKRFANYPNTSFINKSFMDADFESNTLDYILLANASRYIPAGEEDVFFNKVKSWLKPNGYFIILSDNIFGTNTLGRILVSIFYRLANDTNSKTALEWSLEPELKKHFNVEKSEKVGWAWHGHAKHTAFFCKKTN